MDRQWSIRRAVLFWHPVRSWEYEQVPDSIWLESEADDRLTYEEGTHGDRAEKRRGAENATSWCAEIETSNCAIRTGGCYGRWWRRRHSAGEADLSKPQAIIEALCVALGLVEVKVSLSDVVFLKRMILIMCYRSLSLHTARRSWFRLFTTSWFWLRGDLLQLVRGSRTPGWPR